MEDSEIQLELGLLKDRMFTMLHIWTMLEDALSMLLQIAMMPGNVNRKKFGFAAYFATDSAYSRFQVVDAVIEEFFDKEPHEVQALAAWNELMRRLDKVKSVRNSIAHGTVSAPVVHGRQYARISGPMLEIKRHKGRSAAEGMSLDDIEKAIKKCGRCMVGVQAMVQIVQATILKNHDTPTLQRICRELEEHLKIESDRMFAPSPSILPVPQQSSSA